MPKETSTVPAQEQPPAVRGKNGRPPLARQGAVDINLDPARTVIVRQEAVDQAEPPTQGDDDSQKASPRVAESGLSAAETHLFRVKRVLNLSDLEQKTLEKIDELDELDEKELENLSLSMQLKIK